MEKLQNVVVRDVKMGKNGVNKRGPWQAWGIYLERCEVKFDYFEKGGIVPFAGMQIELLEYVVEQNGEYTNYQVKKLVPATLAGDSQLPVAAKAGGLAALPARPEQSGVSGGLSAAEKNKRFTMCTAYAKDIMVELIRTDACDSPYRHANLSAIMGAVVKARNILLDEAGEVAKKAPAAPPAITPEAVKKLAEKATPVVVEPESAALPVVTVTPEMVKLANDALPGTESGQERLNVPGAPQYDDDIPF